MNKLSSQSKITSFFNNIKNTNNSFFPKESQSINTNLSGGTKKTIVFDKPDTISSSKTLKDLFNSPKNGLICFTDGSCIHNGKKYAKGSWAVIFPNNQEYNFAGPLNDGFTPTNNRAEYTALINACKQANTIDPTMRQTLTVYSDSELLIKSMTKWIKSWKKNNWKKHDGYPVQNKDLLIELDNFFNKRNIVMIHVRSHTNDNSYESYWNDKVDLMAKSNLPKSSSKNDKK